MQQHQLAAPVEHRAALRRLDLERHPGRRVVVGIAHHDQAVGLAQAELGPRGQGRVGAVEHERRFHLAAREPLGLLVERFGSQHLHLGADAAERIGQHHRESRRGNVGAARQQREGARLAAPAGSVLRIARHDAAHQRRQDLGMVRGKGVEAGLGQPPDLAVAQRRHAAGTFALRQERHFADQIARRDLGDQHGLAGIAGLVMAKDPERAARNDIDGVGRLALAEQRRAAGQHQQGQLVLDGGQGFGGEVGEQRCLLQHLLQSQPGGILAGHGETHPAVIPFSALRLNFANCAGAALPSSPRTR